MLEQATSVPMDVMTAVIKADLGLTSVPAAVEVATPLVGSANPTVVTLDLSSTSDVYDDGRWLTPDVEDEAARAAVRDGADLVVTAYGQPRLNRAPKLTQHSPAVVPTGIGMWPASDTPLVAPWDGEVVSASGDGVTFRGGGYELTLSGVHATASGGLRAGEPLAEAPAQRWTQISVRPVGAPAAPEFTTAELAPGWLALTRDPRPLLGLAATEVRTAGDLLSRRDASFAQVQEHYYRTPPQIERGWRNYLLSTRGRCYLDMVNNVTVLGHAHPRVAGTAARQLRKLNTNSRFNYEAVVEFSERLAATLPDPLDTVFLVNSGSEASDLAIRLATAATGRRDVVAVREAYHGWTYGTDAVSTSDRRQPQCACDAPRLGAHGGVAQQLPGQVPRRRGTRYAGDAVRQIEGLIAGGRAPAAFICESVYGNAGGMALPDGYLQQVYAAVRAGGGLAISDEVQVGYGRLGEWFWGFQQQDAVPDIVSIAKSTGNGYPLGAVITSRAVADRFSSEGYFFSSTGGSPLSCAIGITVLDVLRDEGLQENASRVGAHLKAGLQALQQRHPIIGTVHGIGLYLGVEMIRDAKTLEPATEETTAICDRMLELGVIIQPTGDHLNILKTKPPLCIDTEGADFYVDTLDRVLTEGFARAPHGTLSQGVSRHLCVCSHETAARPPVTCGVDLHGVAGFYQGMTQTPDEVVTEFCKKWASPDLAELAGYFTDDGVYHNIPMDPVQGPDAIKEFIAGFTAAFDGIDFQVHRQISDGKRRDERAHRRDAAQGRRRDRAAGDGGVRDRRRQDREVVRLLRHGDGDEGVRQSCAGWSHPRAVAKVRVATACRNTLRS